MENPTKIDDLGIPLFFGNTHLTQRSYPAPFARKIVEAAMAMRDQPPVWSLPVPLL